MGNLSDKNLQLAIQYLGDRIRLARLRRNFPVNQIQDWTGLSRDTLYRIEKGDPGVSIGAVAKVLQVMGLHKDLDKIAQDERLKQIHDQADVKKRRRANR